MQRIDTSPWDAVERAIVRRARLRVCLVVGLAVTALVIVVGGVAYAMLIHAQESQIQRELRYAAAFGDPSGPPGCVWIFVLDGSTVRSGPVPPPAGLPLRGTLETVAASHATTLRTLERNGTLYFVRTQPRANATVQVVFDARYQLADRRSLLLALVLAAVTGMLTAVTAGLLMGRQAVAPLTEALARQRRFVADASHELRTPIAQVHLRAQLMARRNHDQRAELEHLVAATGRLGEIVDEMLLSASLAGTRLDRATAEPVDLTTLATTALAAEADRAAERGVTITLSRPQRPLAVAGVPSALRRVVGELLANALTHTPPGGRIDVIVRDTDRGRAEVVVADTGTGFDPANADRLFDRFHHGPGGGRRFGLGLALLREVIMSHGGTIDATGHPGQGATFTVRLPLAIPPATPRRRRRSGRTAARPPALRYP